MAQSNDDLKGPDLTEGVELSELEDRRPLLGHAHGEAVILVKDGDDLFALNATCTHYGGPLAEGLVADGAVRCPWHHARFDLRSGSARTPAMDPVSCFDVVVDDGRVRVGERRERPEPKSPPRRPESVVIVGGGAAGSACAERLREKGYNGPIVVVSDEGTYPVDRPNLSKDYLAGNAPEEWLPVRTEDFYEDHDITWKHAMVRRIDTDAREVALDDGERVPYEALLLATGAEPRTLSIEGAGLGHVHTLRSRRDSVAIASRAKKGGRAVVIGGSFIGLEVAASLRERDVEVTVVDPAAVPLEHVMGLELGRAVQVIHENHGVEFALGHRPTKITPEYVQLDDGRQLDADLVVIGIGVQPRTSLAEQAGIDVDDGVIVDRRMRTSVDGVYAAGDIARFPDDGHNTRIEHWVVAGRQGEAAAMSILGYEEEFDDVPFFWSQHYDTKISYVGHAPSFESIDIAGSLAERDATVMYRNADGEILAVATLGRPGASLQAELALARGDTEALEALVAEPGATSRAVR
jgi:NADPH-dependent 2,4-dienoyl-CoA reductase/sulfur reductase-like enzyme/nitrite reductase/ring-hydroxylating ferredoxin subunit